MPLNVALVAQIRAALTAAKLSGPLSEKRASCDNALRCLDSLIESEKHCGYANYETFLVKLGIDNSKGTKADALELAAAHQGIALADALKDYVETWTDADCGTRARNALLGDLKNAALGRVDWRELAGELTREIAEGVN